MPRPRKIQRGKKWLPKRTIILDGHKTSVTMEEAFWVALKEIAAARGNTMSQLLTSIDSERRERQHINLSSAIRLFVLDCYRSRMQP
jgi:predicted DNA-binding ribbon-helix-helix protein